MAGRARFADRVHFPGLGRVLAGGKPGHLALVFLPLRLPAHDQDALARAEQVGIERCLVTGTVPDQVFFPAAGLSPGVLIPVAGLARKTDDDVVRPAVAVQVFCPAGKALTVAVGSIAIFAHGPDLVHLPVRCLVPDVAGQDVHLAVVVDIRHRHSFGSEDLIDHRLLPVNGRLRRIDARRQCRQRRDGQEQKRNQADSGRHGRSSIGFRGMWGQAAPCRQGKRQRQQLSAFQTVAATPC